MPLDTARPGRGSNHEYHPGSQTVRRTAIRPTRVAFANPNGLSLFVAPRGLAWNSSNSLSIGRFPYDPLDRTVEAPFVEDDDLVVTFQPGCVAAGFSVIDLHTTLSGEIVQVFTSDDLIHEFKFPKLFLGVVSTAHPIVRILISEAADDYGDVTYDDFVCVR